MQVGHLNHIQYPGIGNQPAAPSTTNLPTADDGGGGALQDARGKGRGAEVRLTTPAQNAPGVIAKIQSGTVGSGATLPPGLVYSNARKASATEDTEAETARMQAQHAQALERTAGTPAQLALDKNGLLVAKPAKTADEKEKDFVSFAVSAMRDYADEQARLKALNTVPETPAAANLIPRNMGDVQKLAARFKLFS